MQQKLSEKYHYSGRYFRTPFALCMIRFRKWRQHIVKSIYYETVHNFMLRAGGSALSFCGRSRAGPGDPE
jgi:hypothetical protein